MDFKQSDILGPTMYGSIQRTLGTDIGPVIELRHELNFLIIVLATF